MSLSNLYTGRGNIKGRTNSHDKTISSNGFSDQIKYNTIRRNHEGEYLNIFGTLTKNDYGIELDDREACMIYLTSKLRPMDQDRLNILTPNSLRKTKMTSYEMMAMGSVFYQEFATQQPNITRHCLISKLN